VTIGSTFASALSGLTAASKAVELVSSNIANASTPGYGRRELQLTARSVGSYGQGVQIVGVTRVANQPLISDRRLAQSEEGNAQTRATFYARVETSMGTPDQPYSLNGRVAALDSALTEATAHPESEPRLSAAVTAAKSLVGTISALANDVQVARTAADSEIGAEVKKLNAGLDRVAKLNVQIGKSFGIGKDTSALQDQRQQVIDQLAQIVPLREIPHDDGSVALYTTNGGPLVDGVPSVFGFSASSGISAAMTLQSGGLSGLTLNGVATATAGESSVIQGGTLAANFAIRDELGVTAQAQIDAVSRDLVERFQDSSVDATRASGATGLFTDNGAAFDPANELGLAQRLKLNVAVDPAQGGALWRLRDGLGAATAGPPGGTALLTALRGALTSGRNPASGGFMAGQRSFSGLAGDLLSISASNKLTAQGEQTFASARLDSLTSMEAADGVDTDQEMQSLLQIEQSYAANAKVIKAVDDMMTNLMDL
jgi:flagellar hook-associated protein 1 FlgK